MKKSPKENPAICGQKRPKAARSGHEKHDRETAPELEFRNFKPSQHQSLVVLLGERPTAAAARRTGIKERILLSRPEGSSHKVFKRLPNVSSDLDNSVVSGVPSIM